MIMVRLRQNRYAYVINAKKINLIRSHRHEVRMVILKLDIFYLPVVSLEITHRHFSDRTKNFVFMSHRVIFSEQAYQKVYQVHIGTY